MMKWKVVLSENYMVFLIPYGGNIHKASRVIAMLKMCTFTSDKHALPHWKFVLKWCSNFPSIVIPVEYYSGA